MPTNYETDAGSLKLSLYLRVVSFNMVWSNKARERIMYTRRQEGLEGRDPRAKEDKVKLTKTPKRKMYLKLQFKDPALEIYQSGSNNGQAMRVDDLEVGDRCALQ